jgi:epoxide hydrolase
MHCLTSSTAPIMPNIQPFSVSFNQAALDDLTARLFDARWAEPETVDNWTQGVPQQYLREICDYWANGYDFRRLENRLNPYPQFVTKLDELDIHFLHIRSAVENAKPLLMTHGWPGSVVEFLKVIEPLTDPEAHGGSEDDAFHLVVPSLPGYGFSAKPTTTGWGIIKIASVWNALMQRLGYDQYYAQGGDWGAGITSEIAEQNLGNCLGIHINMPAAWPTKISREKPTKRDTAAFKGARFYRDWDSGYSHQQSTRPQSLGYALNDSPIAQAAWILEKFHAWTDCNGHPENAVSKDELLDNITLYWLTASGASSARLYWESFRHLIQGPEHEIALPAACSIFPKEIVPTPREWAAQRYTNIVYWNYLDSGGHFAAFEQPGLFVQELRAAFRAIEKSLE